MIEYTVENEFDASVDHYWETFFSPEFNAALWKHLDIDYELLELRREGEGMNAVIHRRQRMTPRREVPALLRRLVSGAISYEERNVWKRATSRMEVITIPSFMSEKVETRGSYEVIERSPTRVLRRWQGAVGCTVPLVGGTVEKHIVGEVKDSYAKTTQFMTEWFKAHPAG